MKATTYKVSNTHGSAYAMYEDGFLTMLISELKPPMNEFLYDLFPLKEFDLQHSEIYTAKLLVPKSVADKVALFCLLYKKHKKQPYRAQKIEKANLKNVTVTEQLLNAYFTNVNYPLNTTKTMADYVRHYNTIRDLAVNGVSLSLSKTFPKVYDMQYEKMICDDISKLQRYWAHLRALGWKKTQNGWKSPEQLKALF